ncbi:hypothetical protein KCU71_g1980, partial [Aureobasidium melanogenum]
MHGIAMYRTRHINGKLGLEGLMALVVVATVLLPGALAHDSEYGPHGSFEDSYANDTATLDTYFTQVEHAGIMYGHIIAMTIAWVVVLPIAVMLSLANSRTRVLVQFVFFSMNALGVALAISYNALTPDLYPNNAHHRIGWIITLVATIAIPVSSLFGIGQVIRRQVGVQVIEPEPAFTSFAPRNYNPADCSSDNVSMPHSKRNSPETDIASLSWHEDSHIDESCTNADQEEKDSLLPMVDSHPRLSFLSAGFFSLAYWKYLRIFSRMIDYIILPFAFVAITTGIVTYGRFFEGHTMFGGLAHWIKGGVFVWLGLFTLGRWCGSFAEWGWAWNICPSRDETWRPSAEFVESALICFYGCTNIFLEHISGWGGRWTSRDLEHVAISVLFIGGGALGILVESSWIKQLLNTTIYHRTLSSSHTKSEREQQRHSPGTRCSSLNPIPALVILLLGVMMSSHEQATMMGTMLHTQWGNLLSCAALARALTYVILYLKPPTSIFPSRVPTELLTAFGLISGGVIFMASSDDTIEGMIHYGLDAMFMYTVTMGVVGLLMAWEVTLLAFKGWAVRNECRNGTQSSETAVHD